jgi:Heterokaryon incompatibility protein (HET)
METFAKVKGCCSQAKLDGFDYVWVDTCCIDKTSSAGLSEAINSMYRWYKEAQVCYAFLADVPIEEDLQYLNSSIAKSRWFTRGWTLQELIAPSNIVFYGENWREIGMKLSLQN